MIRSQLLEDYLTDQNGSMKELVANFLNQVMELEASRQIGAQPYERSSARKARHNGKRKRNLKTRYGEITL